MFFFKQKTAYEMRISDWSSDVCSSDLVLGAVHHGAEGLNRVQVVPAPFLGSTERVLAAQPGAGKTLEEVEPHLLEIAGETRDQQPLPGIGRVHRRRARLRPVEAETGTDRKSTRLNSSH